MLITKKYANTYTYHTYVITLHLLHMYVLLKVPHNMAIELWIGRVRRVSQ